MLAQFLPVFFLCIFKNCMMTFICLLLSLLPPVLSVVYCVEQQEIWAFWKLVLKKKPYNIIRWSFSPTSSNMLMFSRLVFNKHLLKLVYVPDPVLFSRCAMIKQCPCIQESLRMVKSQMLQWAHLVLQKVRICQSKDTEEEGVRHSNSGSPFGLM